MRATRPARGERGFTFIEVLVVMGILSVLAGLAFVGLSLWSRKRPQLETETRIRKLSVATNAYYQRFGRYPPIDARRIQSGAGGTKSIKALPNSSNEGIESLFQALYWETAGVKVDLGDKDLVNTDDDELSEAVTSQGKKLWEIVDGWGNPLFYFPHTEYARATESPPSYTTASGEEMTPKPWKYEAEGRTGFAQPDSFQIFSAGPDGIPNTQDDVKSWD